MQPSPAQKGRVDSTEDNRAVRRKPSTYPSGREEIQRRLHSLVNVRRTVIGLLGTQIDDSEENRGLTRALRCYSALQKAVYCGYDWANMIEGDATGRGQFSFRVSLGKHIEVGVFHPPQDACQEPIWMVVDIRKVDKYPAFQGGTGTTAGSV